MALSAELAQWRSGERQRLKAERLALTADARAAQAHALARHLDALLGQKYGDVSGLIVSAYWPIKAEYDLRFWMHRLHQRGAVVALPVVETVKAPLVFRHWTPDTKMEKGFWNIPVPPASAGIVYPEISLAPLVGWDAACYRLGYGGGYFDRTLAAASPRPFVIGVGAQSAQIASIQPQPHDIRLDAIVTEQGVQVLR
ncbi:5-formyltetrahydrofolate cyclo-ligase [Aestuariivirga litoralis]|uniref:5-formyltetrahydrofolate cyclo-ligase n=1 Tax=Aestuariivirga litoralis TaxID=2650924 RepID=UPI0018C7B07B|nr:5-formyltetrahydrofolate cyclo-ligase [Aestuariivirga litoralis]MBG1233409.1 5-formyltetrahydrofolate cyclo-ligase [Aestuariivirga litoralis]